MMRKYLPIAIVIIVVGVSAFYGGMRYGQGTNNQSASLMANFRGQAGGQFRGNGQGLASGNFAGGQIIAKDANSITVKLQDGSSKIVFVSDSTQITKSAQGSLNDLAVGENITVAGTANSDGSITSQSIQIRPAGPQGQQNK